MGDFREMANHTIVLYQLSKSVNTRHWDEFPNKAEAMDGICRLYELNLKRLNPTKKTVSYALEDLFIYVDSLADLSCLMYDNKTSAYVPYGREWVKKALVARLKAVSKK